MSDLPGLDLAALAAWWPEHVGPLAGDLSATLIAGGKSNLTYAVTDGGSTWIVRRPPLGHVLATAHDMAREYRVMTALRDTDVPVPTPVVGCTDPAVTGGPFYVMDFVDGTILRTPEDSAPLSPAQHRRAARPGSTG